MASALKTSDLATSSQAIDNHTHTMFEYKHLTQAERDHFVEHGWLKVENAIDPKYMDAWLADFWVRLGWDKDDKSTWTEEYIKQPRHREVLGPELCPKAWAKMCEVVGGEDKIDPVRERYFGDQWIVNFGSEARTKETGPIDHRNLPGWHTDNDWYRHFLDSSGNALTIIFCFTDVLPDGGGTVLCEDGIRRICEILYDHPEGLDPPYTNKVLYQHCKESRKFTQVEAKKGDVFVTHGLLPHAHTPNRLWYPRIITNPHVNLVEPWNFNRPDGDYTLCEKVVLRALERESIPEYKATRPRTAFYPRTAWFKREKVSDELRRMVADAEARGGSAKDVDSVYLRGEQAIAEHERRNGYDKDFGEHGVSQTQSSGSVAYHPPVKRQIFA